MHEHLRLEAFRYKTKHQFAMVSRRGDQNRDLSTIDPATAGAVMQAWTPCSWSAVITLANYLHLNRSVLAHRVWVFG